MQKAQMQRLVRIAAELKENRYPNSESLEKEFRRIALEEEINIECSRKTIQRDFHYLRDECGCPLVFDHAKNGYRLKHHGWNLILPALLDENEMLASVIGARISENIFPPPLKNRIRDAVDALLMENNPDFLDTANMESLTILSGLYANPDPDIFMTIFTAWQQHRSVDIKYSDFCGGFSERRIEPHTFVFYSNSWYTKGFCRLKNQVRTFALQRIRSARITEETFEPDNAIIDSVSVDNFLEFLKIKNVILRISPELRDRFTNHPLHSGQTMNDEGIVHIPSVSKEVLFPFLLSMGYGAVLQEPVELRREFLDLLDRIKNAYAK